SASAPVLLSWAWLKKSRFLVLLPGTLNTKRERRPWVSVGEVCAARSPQPKTEVAARLGVTGGEPGPKSTCVSTISLGLLRLSLVTTQRSVVSKVESPELVPGITVKASVPRLVATVTVTGMAEAVTLTNEARVRSVSELAMP